MFHTIPDIDAVCIFDVSSRPDFYGPEGPYHVFTGRDASRALATMGLKEENSNIDDLSADQLKVMEGMCSFSRTQRFRSCALVHVLL